MKMDKWLLACAIAMLSIACSDNEEEIIQPTPAPAEIRVLTFEDADYKGGDNLVGERNWSSLVDLEYEGPLLYPTDNTLYRWADDNNTFLASEFPNNYGDYKFWGGGEALSHYTLTDYTHLPAAALRRLHPPRYGLRRSRGLAELLRTQRIRQRQHRLGTPFQRRKGPHRRPPVGRQHGLRAEQRPDRR